jgi:hypothetical protein
MRPLKKDNQDMHKKEKFFREVFFSWRFKDHGVIAKVIEARTIDNKKIPGPGPARGPRRAF